MISSLSNSKIKMVQKLQKSAKYRQEQEKFIVEGWRIMNEVPMDRFDTIFVLEKDLGQLEAFKVEAHLVIETVSEQVLKSMSNDLAPQGIMAVVNMTSEDKSEELVDNELIVALECVQDPGNLGTILRTADAAGVTKVILSKGTVDVFNPKVVKATMGAIFRLNIQREVDLIAYIKDIKEKGVKVYAAHLKGDRNHYKGDYRNSTCFLMGNEGNGLSEALANLASAYIKIPMRQEAESLNVAVATSILVYEAIRQRDI